MKNRIFIMLYTFAFLVFLLFNSPKCIGFKKFSNIDELENYLRKNNNYFNDNKIFKPNKFEQIYYLKQESLRIFKKCI